VTSVEKLHAAADGNEVRRDVQRVGHDECKDQAAEDEAADAAEALDR